MKSGFLQDKLRCKIALIVSIFTIVVFSVISFSYNSEWFSVCVWVIPCMIIIGVLGANNNSKLVHRVFENRFIINIGNCSFEIFLLHQLIIRYVNFLIQNNNVLRFFIDISFVVLGVRVWNLVSKKFEFKWEIKKL